MRRIVYTLFFVFAFLFVWNTDIENRTEAEDAFEYAYQVENNGHDWLYHPHHLLYGAITRDIYNGARLLGYSGRAYPLLRLISALCGAGVVLMFFRFCYRRFSMRPVSSLLCSGLLLFSYGFWRYANEAEVIVPACLIMLYALYASVMPDQTKRWSALAGVLCGVSVLFHVMNGVPVFVAVPLFYLFQKNLKGMLINAAAAISVVATGYIAVYWFESSRVAASAGLSLSLSWSSLEKALIAFSQCVASSNFMLGFEFIRDALVRLFPSRMLLEEIYMGQSLSRGSVLSAALIMALLICCFLGTTIFALRLLLRTGVERRRDRVGAAAGWQTLVVTIVWFGGYAGALLFLEPGNPEVWVMGLVPFWLAFCGLIVAPLSKQNVLWPVLLLVALLGLHNYVGGIRPLQNPEGDYNQQKAEWVLQNATAADVILTADNPVFERYLRYHSPAQVEYLHGWASDRLVSSGGLPQGSPDQGKLFLMGDVFSIPDSMTRRFPVSSKFIGQFAKQVRPRALPVHEDNFGGVYVLDAAGEL